MRNLDLLRAFAVLSVFFAHLIRDLGFPDPGSLGRFGVVLFFVHTSFVLMYSLKRLESAGKITRLSHLCNLFFIRRFFRIYPLAIVFVLATVAFHVPSAPYKTWFWVGPKALLSNLALVTNLTYSDNVLAVLWSLPLEVQMYAMLPFAYFFLKGRKYGGVILWILSLLSTLLSLRLSGRLTVFLYAPCFISGVLAFDLIGRIKQKLPAWVFPVTLLGVTLIFQPFDNIPLPYKLNRAWPLSLVLGLAIAACKDGQWRGLHTVAHWIAERSYGVYLSHSVIFWFALDFMHASPPVLKYLIIAVGGVAVPMLAYLFIEKPLINVGARLAIQFDSWTTHLQLQRVPERPAA